MWLPVWQSAKYPILLSMFSNSLADVTGSLDMYIYCLFFNCKRDWFAMPVKPDSAPAPHENLRQALQTARPPPSQGMHAGFLLQPGMGELLLGGKGFGNSGTDDSSTWLASCTAPARTYPPKGCRRTWNVRFGAVMVGSNFTWIGNNVDIT